MFPVCERENESLFVSCLFFYADANVHFLRINTEFVYLREDTNEKYKATCRVDKWRPEEEEEEKEEQEEEKEEAL